VDAPAPPVAVLGCRRSCLIADVLGVVRKLKSIGGIPFTCGPLGYLLRNRFYIGIVPIVPPIIASLKYCA
jgi:hypothetical protein